MVAGAQKPRIRSISMSQVFGNGEWLNGGPPGSSPAPWRIYSKDADIVKPADTWVFVDEHPDSINDSALAVICTGNQASDPQSSSIIVDYPASYHNGACGFSFADGHSEIHKWLGSAIKPPVRGVVIPNAGAGNDSWVDMHWMAARTTVRQ